MPAAEQAIGRPPRLARRPETWERGFNVICLAAGRTADLTAAASALSLGPELFESMAASIPFPIARLATFAEAERLADYLAHNGFQCRVVSDEELDAGPPQRVRSVGLGIATLTIELFNSGETIELDRSDLLLFVSGSLTEVRSDTSEVKKRGRSEVTDHVLERTDESVLDIYTRQSANACRVSAAGFDFSFLGSKKGILAARNMSLLTEELKRSLADVSWVEFTPVAKLLENVWPLERRTETAGITRRAFGKPEHHRVGISSNKQQFSRYSRLHRMLI
jgi:hypothetical protein